MPNAKVDMARWARAQTRVSRRIAREARENTPPFALALRHVDELRAFAAELGSRAPRARAERENLAYHLVWKQVRRAFGLG